MENKSNLKESLIPSIVLVLICLVVTFALAFTNKATSPQIAKIAKANADKARTQVLPKADSFDPYKGKLNSGIVDCYISKNKAGMAITSVSKSFGGDITVMTGIDAKEKITGVTVTNHADTPGLGTKAMTVKYLNCYKGDSELKAASVKDEKNVDYIVGTSVCAEIGRASCRERV